jgi:ferredoxin
MARVEAIHTMCVGHGLCAEVAPELFRVDKWGCVEVVLADVPAEVVARARAAVYRCPAKALLIDEG